MGTHFLLFSLLFLVACGDGRDSPLTTTDGTSSGSLPRGASLLRHKSSTQFSDAFVPLASQFLVPSVGNQFRSGTLENFSFSQAQGHFPEEIQAQAEALGLTLAGSALGLTGGVSESASGLSWKAVDSGHNLQLADDSLVGVAARLRRMQLFLDGIPVHASEMKSIVEDGTVTWLTGSRPQWLSTHETPRTTPFSLSVDQAKQMASHELGFAFWRFHSVKRKYVAEPSLARATYLFVVSAESSPLDHGPFVPLEVAVDADVGRVLWQRPLAFHVTEGSTELFVENVKVAEAKSQVSLPGLLTPQTLSHSLFDVYNCRNSPRSLENGSGNVCKPVATGVNGVFSADYDDERYDELIAYAAVTRAMGWYRDVEQNSLRSDWDPNKWPGSRANFGLEPSNISNGSEKRLKIFVRTETPAASVNKCGKDTTPDNAQYLWSGQTGNGNPEILIGYGGYPNACGSLRELGKDMDVILHEFGHHIVYRGLSNTKNQSVALHEGFADYFTYAITGNNLLAENSNPGQVALRQGNVKAGQTFNKFLSRADGGYITVMDYLIYPHRVGEFWSAILWELRLTLGRDASGKFKMDKIVWDTIDLVSAEGGLGDGVLAISESTKRYAERMGEDVYALQKSVNDVFVKYEFARYGSNGELVPVNGLLSGTTVTSSPAPAKKKKTWGCGDIATASKSSRTDSTTTRTSFLLLSVPLLVAWGLVQPRRLRLRAQVRKHSPRRKN